MGPQLRRVWRSRGTIADPEFCLDIPMNGEPAIVIPPTRLELLGGSVVLVFDGAAYSPHSIPGRFEEFPHYPLRYFITYQTRIDYNIVYPEWQQEAALLPREADQVTFHLSRSVARRTPGGHEYHESEPCTITLEREALEEFLRVHTEELYLAIVYYLVGCQNPQYFLIEFFKAIEVIENAFGGEQLAIAALGPHGVVGSDFKAVKRYGNDQLRPFNVGRHAPRKGVNLRLIDVRSLFEQPASREIFHHAVKATRQAIDGYFSWLRNSQS